MARPGTTSSGFTRKGIARFSRPRLHPDIVAELIANWEAYMASVGGIEPIQARGYYPYPKPTRGDAARATR